MHFSLTFVAIAVTLSSVVAFPGPGQGDNNINYDLSPSNNYNAHLPPWVYGSHPGWYYGSHPVPNSRYPCLGPDTCKKLKHHPDQLQCPTSPPSYDGYTETFNNLTGATQASDYMTYGLVATIADCLAMCNSVAGCVFVNTYDDVNGKGGSTDLTCSLFSQCHNSSDADNYGGQTQPDGSVDYITNSDGWCKN